MWPLVFKLLDDPDVIKNHKNEVATFPNMLQTLGFLMNNFSECIQTVNSAQSKYSTHQNICNMADINKLENVCIA
jgi:CRISPR/Cas system-associated protein endoribonuclease Cas2